MAKYAGKRGDLTWGKYGYPVTRTQKAALDGLWYMMSKLPRAYNSDIPAGGFCSQREDNGDVIIGLHYCSVNVHRNGRITSNERPIQVHSNLLKTSCQKHGLFDGEVCPFCEAIERSRVA